MSVRKNINSLQRKNRSWPKQKHTTTLQWGLVGLFEVFWLVDPLGRPTITSICMAVRPHFSKSSQAKQMSSEDNVHSWRDCGSGRVDHWWHLTSFSFYFRDQRLFTLCLSLIGVLCFTLADTCLYFAYSDGAYTNNDRWFGMMLRSAIQIVTGVIMSIMVKKYPWGPGKKLAVLITIVRKIDCYVYSNDIESLTYTFRVFLLLCWSHVWTELQEKFLPCCKWHSNCLLQWSLWFLYCPCACKYKRR